MFTYKSISPTDARNRFFQLLEQVAENHQVFIINRREEENVALIASDLTSLVETVYLLRNPANSRRLLDAIAQSKTGKIQPQSIAELKQELNFVLNSDNYQPPL